MENTCICVLLFIGFAYAQDGPIIKLPDGQIQGNIQKSYGGRDFTAFEGIPYAKPPIGDLRFEEAEVVNPWEDIKIANNSPVCMQINSASGNEDCLYVNVYVSGGEIKQDANLDVIIHIHGGAFIVGAPKVMAGPRYIMDKDVIFVTLSYRLGIFGFLSTEDDVVPGNNGLKDQSLALKWIKNNIKYFGGNDNSITLTGLSAGSASVHNHYLSPRSKGLFNRGIMQSGTALNPWALVENPLENAKKLGNMFNCTQNTNADMVSCLKGVNADELAQSLNQFFVFVSTVPFDPFGPVIEKGGDNPFIAEHPYKLLTEGRLANDVPTIMSGTEAEGIFPVGVYALFDKIPEMNTKWDELMPYAMDIQETVEKSKQIEVVQQIKKYYFKDEPLTLDNINILTQMNTDRLFFIDFQKAIKLHARASKYPLYFYYFSYIADQPKIFDKITGAAHTYDTRLLYNLIADQEVLSENDKAMVDFFTGVVSEFAKNGDPKIMNGKWEPVNKDNEGFDFLHIYSGNKYAMEKTKEFAPTAFWNELPIQENDKLFL